MNNIHVSSSHRPDAETLQARYALRVTARLSEGAQQAPHDVSERLRFARERAMARAAELRKAPVAQTATAPVVVRAGRGVAALGFGSNGSSWWWKVASFAPLVMLLVGLGAIEKAHDKTQIAAAAEIDSALLADNLPPDAYRDAGFVEYLKTAPQ